MNYAGHVCIHMNDLLLKSCEFYKKCVIWENKMLFMFGNIGVCVHVRWEVNLIDSARRYICDILTMRTIPGGSLLSTKYHNYLDYVNKEVMVAWKCFPYATNTYMNTKFKGL